MPPLPSPEDGSGPPALDQLGYEAQDLDAIRRALRAPDGLVLVAGPAGSGKRTTLYSMLEELEPLRRSVRTVESRSLRAVARWRQAQVPDCRGRLNGRQWERAFVRVLRDGAEAILLEKIAAPGIAQLAIQAAQDGHLVLSTIAVGRACSAIAELQRLQVTMPQVVDGLSMVICQRLIGRLCPECSVPDDREPIRQSLAVALNTWLHGHAVHARRAASSRCAQCRQTGYVGRVLVYELVDVDARARGLIASSVDPIELEHALIAEGTTIWDRGLKYVADGTTSFDALIRGVRQPH